MSILIKDVLVNGAEKDIYIEDNLIKGIKRNIRNEAAVTIDGKHKAAIPSFFNGHTHAAMVLLRGYADDMPLDDWLNNKIWPIESKLTEEDVYWGTRLACLEMIKSGTTFFNDMYWHYHGVARAVEDAGIRAAVSAVFIDLFDVGKAADQIELNRRLFEETKQYSNRILFALGPHTLYTVSKRSLQWAKEFADENNLLIHIHRSETQKEVKDCIRQNGKRPVEYLNDIGFLGSNMIAGHVIWVNDSEIELLQEHDVKIIYNPTSNMKLSSGIFPYSKMKSAQIDVALGTDGCASNNNLDILEEMKFAALLQKLSDNNPSVLPAYEVFRLATKNVNSVFKIGAGELKVGYLADLLLVNIKHVHLTPHNNLIPNLVYSAHGSCIDTTICDGKILMQDGIVDEEEEIIEKAQEIALALVRR
ncbi:MAG: amidohydrolase [Thiotrichaceae bacterium]